MVRSFIAIELPAEVRERTDALDAMGNTTAATGKGFAIGSAVLTALALLAAYVEEVRAGLIRANIPVPAGVSFGSWREARLGDLAAYYNLSLMNIKVLVGLVLGAMLTFVFCSMAMKAVGRAARKMVEEVRRQFHSMPGIMEGTTKPDYARCVEFDLAGTACEDVIAGGQTLFQPRDAGVRWPLERAYERDSYLGLPCLDSQGRVIGHIACADPGPMPDDLPQQAILRIFAVRAGLELERKQLERERRAVGMRAAPETYLALH